jgi:hypothetical protein
LRFKLTSAISEDRLELIQTKLRELKDVDISQLPKACNFGLTWKRRLPPAVQQVSRVDVVQGVDRSRNGTPQSLDHALLPDALRKDADRNQVVPRLRRMARKTDAIYGRHQASIGSIILAKTAAAFLTFSGAVSIRTERAKRSDA